jgi:hypothetical protein
MFSNAMSACTGSVPTREARFTDGATAANAPLDNNALGTWSSPNPSTPAYYYAVASVDIAGNRSSPSAPFGARMLAVALA